MKLHRWEDIRGQDHDSERVDAAKRDVVADQIAYTLAELRAAHDLTQNQLAEVLQAAQSSISRIEHQDDTLVSTLRAYIEALGGHLELAAVFDNQRVRIDA